MHDPAAVVEVLRTATLVGVVRAPSEAGARAAVEGLLDGGFRAVQISAETPGCLGLVAELARRARNLAIGVGGVRSLETVAGARAAGAGFVVTPHAQVELIREARVSGLVAIAGGFTATEVLVAHEAGAAFVQLFPVSAGGGPDLVRTLRAALPDVPFAVCGDVALENIPDHLTAGAQLIGLTTALTGNLDDKTPDDIRAAVAERATACLSKAAEARDQHVVLTLVTPERTLELDLRALRKLPGSEHVSIDNIVPGRSGHGVRLRRLLEPLGLHTGPVRLVSTDGFERDLSGDQLFAAGVLQHAAEGRPLDAHQGGPLRLYLADGTDRCDNVKGLTRIERATPRSDP